MAKSQNEIEAERRRGIKQGLPNGVIFTDDSTNTPPAEPLTIPSLSDDDLRSIAREKLSQAIQTIDPVKQPELTRKLCAELMDRLDGKPVQKQVIDGDMRPVIQIVQFGDVKSLEMLHDDRIQNQKREENRLIPRQE